ncbi:MAG TPA: ribonuclease HI [Vicinamibacteria bacterium]|jgi:ribonuclease HI
MAGKREVRIFTDGACSGNPGPGGWAAIIEENGDRREISGAERRTTNNRMELLAIIRALGSLTEPSRVHVVTDSQYVALGMTRWIHNWQRKGWKTAGGDPVKNRDLWQELLDRSRGHDLTWEWIRGHDGHPENERADALARAAIETLG